MLDRMKSDLRPTTLCAWCGNVMHQGGPELNHGMCAACAEGVIDTIERIEKAERAAGPGSAAIGTISTVAS
jgi:hypothetical protein